MTVLPSKAIGATSARENSKVNDPMGVKKEFNESLNIDSLNFSSYLDAPSRSVWRSLENQSPQLAAQMISLSATSSSYSAYVVQMQSARLVCQSQMPAVRGYS